MKHKIKILEKYADRVLSGEKTFEFRFNDRDYQTGDMIEFIVIDRDLKPIVHELCYKEYLITYILWNMEGLQPGFCVLGIQACKKIGVRI